MAMPSLDSNVTWRSDTVWMTTKQLADLWGISMRRVRQIAKDRGVEGRKIGPICVWTQEQMERMKPRSAGAGSHTRNILIKQLGNDVEELRQNSANA
tara:strand:+ start:632 stop:922 length:291 start_codon:yes stop_codon:yes gene_type:complete